MTNFHQEKLYKRAAARSVSGRAAPEARLYWAAFGGLLFPIGMMAFAWTGQPHIPWPVPALMLVISYWGIYCMYLGVLYVHSEVSRKLGTEGTDFAVTISRTRTRRTLLLPRQRKVLRGILRPAYFRSLRDRWYVVTVVYLPTAPQLRPKSGTADDCGCGSPSWLVFG